MAWTSRSRRREEPPLQTIFKQALPKVLLCVYMPHTQQKLCRCLLQHDLQLCLQAAPYAYAAKQLCALVEALGSWQQKHKPF